MACAPPSVGALRHRFQLLMWRDGGRRGGSDGKGVPVESGGWLRERRSRREERRWRISGIAWAVPPFPFAHTSLPLLLPRFTLTLTSLVSSAAQLTLFFVVRARAALLMSVPALTLASVVAHVTIAFSVGSSSCMCL